MSEIIVTADLGTMNVYEIIRDPLNVESPGLEAIKSSVAAEPREKASEKFSDSAGRFYQGGAAGTKTAGVGEQHNIELETEKRLIKRIAQDINDLVMGKDCEKWYLAAEKSINNQILEYLDPVVKTRLKKNVAVNLTKASKADIMGYFIERRKKAA